MDLSAAALTFSEGKSGAPFLVALVIGMIVALCVPLLRRWPPTPLRWALVAGVLGIGGAALFLVLLDREVRIDPSAREVHASHHLLGIGRLERWPFATFDAVRVEYRPLSVKRRTTQPAPPSSAEVHHRFVVALVGQGAEVRLRDFDEALPAEALARSVAAIGDWRATRRGYAIQSGSGRPGEAMAVGRAQAFEAPDGRSGVGVTLERWVRVEVREGAESPIEAP